MTGQRQKLKAAALCGYIAKLLWGNFYREKTGGKIESLWGKEWSCSRIVDPMLFCYTVLLLTSPLQHSSVLGVAGKKIKWKQRSTVGKLKFITRIYTAKRQKGTDLLLHLYNNSSELTFAKMHQLANLRGINQYCGSNYSYTWGPINFKQSTLWNLKGVTNIK